MEYKIDKAKFANDPLYDTLAALNKSLEQLNLQLYVVGACARDIAMKVLNVPASARRTIDIDVAIALDNWEMFDKVSELLQHNNFKKDPYAKQKFYYKGEDGTNDYEVDVVPFGPLANNEVIGWPPEGNPEMSVRCFEDVMKDADTIIVDESVQFCIASLSGQFLIKLDAWIDRHLKTDKDARDMFYIIDNFYWTSIVDKFPPPEQVTNSDDPAFDDFVAGAQWIASELRSLLSDEHRAYYVDFINSELSLEDNSKLVQHLVTSSNNSDVRNYTSIRIALQNIVNILSA